MAAELSAQQIRTLSSRLAEPGIEQLFRASKREATRLNLRAPTKQAVREAVASVGTRQVYARRPHAGTAASAAVNEKWMCDLVSMQFLETTKGNQGYKFVLLCQDSFSRKLRGTNVRGKSGPEMRGAFERLFQGGVPKVLDSDAGSEFKNPEVAALLTQRGVAQIFKDPGDRGGIALIDSATSKFKNAMYRMLTSRNTSVWIGLTDDVLSALNSRSHEALGGAEPDDVEGNEHLQFALLRSNTARLEKNHQSFVRMSRGIEVGSRFRVPGPQKQRGFRRGAQTQFSSTVYTVAAILQQGRQVRAAENNQVYSVKLILPVAADSAPTGRALEQAGERRTLQVQAQRAG